MSNFERSIVSIIDPTIKTDRIIQPDGESPEAKKDGVAVPEGINTKDTSREGAFFPVIFINTTKFDSDKILSMMLEFDDKIPTISVTLEDTQGKFAIDSPLDGDVISLYIRPPDEENQKPIRIDFDIIEISGDPLSKIFSISGIMKVPGFFAEVCKEFKEGNSFDHLQDVCEEVGLGFASNETATDDAMSRICPFETYQTFVNQTVSHTYKDDDSFFTWYIDPYYYLCLVNINKQFSLEDKTDTININQVTPLSGMPLEDKTKDGNKGTLVLTNRSDRAGTNIYIDNWAMENKSASVWIKNGYKRYSQYLELDENGGNEYVSTFVDPITTKGSESDAILPKGRKGDEFYKKQIKYKWLGKQSIGNVHDNYIFSNLLNFQNLQEINKLSINVDLAGMNFYIYRYMRIPILIYESASTGLDRINKLKDRDKALGEDKGYEDQGKPENPEGTNYSEGGSKPNAENIGTDLRHQLKNEHVSGYYLVNTIKYTYEPPGPIKMKLNLIRREWNIPAKNKNY
jgi:hypothetical protein